MKILIIYLLFIICIYSSNAFTYHFVEQDTTSKLLITESDDDDDIDNVLDSLEAELETEKKWNLYSSVKYSSLNVSKGIDETGGNGSLMQSISIGHNSGFTLGLDIRQSLGNPIKFNDQNVYLDYVYSASDKVDIGATISKQKYADPNSAMAGTNSAFSLYSDINFKSFYLDISYDRYIGTNENFNYLTASAFKSIYLNEAQNIKLSPMMSFTFSSYTIDPTREVKLTKNGLVKTASKAAFGLGSVVIACKLAYKITQDLSISYSPSFNYIPARNGEKSSSDLVHYLSFIYDLDF